MPVEIQIRTRWQHEWAESFEKLADLVGRDIRYGGPPDHPGRRSDPVDMAATVDWTFQVADAIDAVERAESLGSTGKAQADLRDGVWRLLAQFEQLPGRLVGEPGSEGIEVVALSAESEAALRETHARYFLGLKELVARMG